MREQQPLLRAVQAEDREFLQRLYLDGRADEGLRAGLPEALWQGLLLQQFAIREQQYSVAHPQADDSVVLDEVGLPIGRLRVDRSVDALLQLVDIALLGQCQRRGLGRALLLGLQQEAVATARAIELHVAVGSAAERLYESLGFVDGADAMQPEHPYRRLRWQAVCIASTV